MFTCLSKDSIIKFHNFKNGFSWANTFILIKQDFIFSEIHVYVCISHHFWWENGFIGTETTCGTLSRSSHHCLPRDGISCQVVTELRYGWMSMSLKHEDKSVADTMDVRRHRLCFQRCLVQSTRRGAGETKNSWVSVHHSLLGPLLWGFLVT